ncbi:MAG: hypothetical protein H5U40_01780, partial [Polyangiaceae bacterium]|nr:hypothetical protein [Polyangiaceae bacterium]
MSTGPEPLAEGSLEDTPFAHVLVSVERRALSGTLALWPEVPARGPDRLLVEDGRIVAARLLEPASSLELGLL